MPELSTATREELAVLIAVVAEPDFDISALSMKLNITESTLISAVSAWTRKGVLSVVERSQPGRGEVAPIKTTSPKTASPKTTTSESDAGRIKKVAAVQSATLPHYSTEETAAFLEQNPSFTSLLDSCQMILGKFFNAAESAIIIGMADHLALSPEYIMLLFAHAKNMGKDSVRYIEKMALSLFDRGILTYAELLEELGAKESAAKMEEYVRKLFGLGRRALIDSEKAMIDRWTNEYNMSEEMLAKAYEITVSKTGEARFPYMNAILENWHKAGYGTVEEVAAAEEAYKRDKETKDASRSSFTTDEFYEAALRRSYENLPNDKNKQ